MTTPVKVGTRWRHRMMVNGVRVSGTFDTKAAALKWEAHQRLTLGSEQPRTVTETCADAFRRYEQEVSRKKAWLPMGSNAPGCLMRIVPGEGYDGRALSQAHLSQAR